MWYTPEHTLTHNAIINMVIGPRGAGKTFALKSRALKNWETKKQQFVYVRRYDSELQLVRENLFADINRELGKEVRYAEGAYMVGEETIGWPVALTKSSSLKSASYPNVSLIIFDEFIIDPTQHQRYLTNEVDKFLNLFETIARMRDNVKAFLLANSLSFVNPYSIYWNLKQDGSKIVKAKNGLVLCELWEDPEFIEAKKKTRFGQLIEGTTFEEMSIQNKFILDTDTFIAPKPPGCLYYIGMILNGRKYAIWSFPNGFFIDKGFDSYNRTLTFDVADHAENTVLVSKPRVLEPLMRAFRFGKVYFLDQVTKADAMNLFKRWSM